MYSTWSVVVMLLFGVVSVYCYESYDTCDPSCLRLSSVEVFRKEEGWYVGNYTLLGSDGNPFTSDTFPYNYAQYRGFRRVKLKGPCRLSRSVYVYPPLAKADCKSPEDVAGEGRCAINGNEKIFGSESVAADCHGNLVETGAVADVFDGRTFVTLGNDDTLVFQARYMAEDGGLLFQNSLTTIGINGSVLRTTQAFNRGEVAKPRLLSYFREQKVSKREWMKQLANTRANFNVLKSDQCGWNPFNRRSNTTCSEHFSLPSCPLEPQNRRKCKRQLHQFRQARQKVYQAL